MWYAFPSKLRLIEEISAIAGPLAGLWGLAIGSHSVVVAGVVLIFLSSALTDERWRNLALLIVVAMVGDYVGNNFGIANGAAYGLLGVATLHLMILFVARASILDRAEAEARALNLE